MAKKQTSRLDAIQSEVHKNFPPEHYLSDPKHVESVIDWTTFYRRNIHRFAQHYLGLSLHFYQCILLYLMNLFPNVVLIASRAAAKSYLIAIFACCRALLYPRSQVVVASGTKNQAKLIISQKVKLELMRDSQTLADSILRIVDNQNEVVAVFRNGSTFTVCPASNNARGLRATMLVYEEARMIEKNIIDSVLSPFLVVRQTPYLKRPEYEHLVEEPMEVYISSAWYQSSWLWGTMKQAYKDMLIDQTSCILALDYSITLRHNIKTRKYMLQQKKKLDYVSWAIEYENRMISENLKSYFTFDLLHSNQTLTRAFYPKQNSDYSFRGKHKLDIPKMDGEIRLVSCDIAMVEGVTNDNSVFTCIRLIPELVEGDNNKGFRRQVPYLEAHQGGETSEQATRIKQLFEDFDADYCVLDLRNSGISLYDSLAKVLYDSDRDKEYQPWTCMNDAKLAERIKVANALPVVFAISANAKLNSDIAVIMRETLSSHKIDLLVNINDAYGELSKRVPEYSTTMDAETQVWYEKPYLETMCLVNEMLDLEYEVMENTGYIRIREASTKRKDRYTSLSYGNYMASLLELDLFSTNINEIDYSVAPMCVSKIDF